LKLQMRIEGRAMDQGRIVADPAMPPRAVGLQMRGEWAFR
jgi:hypothetical protein